MFTDKTDGGREKVGGTVLRIEYAADKVYNIQNLNISSSRFTAAHPSQGWGLCKQVSKC